MPIHIRDYNSKTNKLSPNNLPNTTNLPSNSVNLFEYINSYLNLSFIT